jgi:hypothetical protein
VAIVAAFSASDSQRSHGAEEIAMEKGWENEVSTPKMLGFKS